MTTQRKISPRIKTQCPSPLGPITLAASACGLTGLWFDGQRHMPDTSAWPEAPSDHPVLLRASDWLQTYFAGEKMPLMLPTGLPLDLSAGTEFQQAVWQALLAIPRGETTSYGALSQRIGKPAAVRAVGAAVGRNPVSILVPCHRVIGINGALTGYAGGLDRKTALLQLEGAL